MSLVRDITGSPDAQGSHYKHGGVEVSSLSEKFAAKEYRQGKEVLFAACDEECLGETYEEGKLKLQVDPGFYDGDRIERATFIAMLQRATVANFVGERAVALAVEMGFIEQGNVIRIDGVPHAQWAVMI
jgi:uncharacterized protein